MKSRNHFVKASLSDGEAMLVLLEEADAGGKIELLYTRRPNPYASYRKESPLGAWVGVVKNPAGRILGQGACVTRACYVHGKKAKAGYLCGLRKSSQDASLWDWAEIIEKIRENTDCEYYFFSVLDENRAAQKMFSKKRSFLPFFYPVCKFTTYILSPTAVMKKLRKELSACRDLSFFQCEEADRERFHSFLNRQGKQLDFFPVLNDIETDLSHVRLSDCYYLQRNGEIVCAAILWDQTEYRQYLVKKYRFPYSLLKRVNFFTKALGYIALPAEGKAVPVLMVSFLVSEKDDLLKKHMLVRLSEKARNAGKILVAGESSALEEGGNPSGLFSSLPSLSFGSRLYVASMKEETPRWNCFFDCGLL